MKKLVRELNKLYNMAGLDTYERGVGSACVYFSHSNVEVRNVAAIAEHELITRGDIDYAAIDELKDHGYVVYPVERAPLGWVIGGIRKKNLAEDNRALTFGQEVLNGDAMAKS